MTTPTQERTLVRQAWDALRRGDHAGARARLDAVLAANRRCIDALDLRAQLLYETGDLEGSMGTLIDAVKLAPKDARLRTNLGRGYLRQGKYTKALAQLEQALKLTPDDPIALTEKVRVHERQGKYARALRALRPALAGAATPPGLAATAVRILDHEGRGDEALALGEAVLGAADTESRGLRQLVFQLARLYERAGRYDDALAAAARGNAIDRAPYDADAMDRWADDVIAFFSPERLATLPRPASPSPRPVFVYGMPRSGTTLVERILHRHPDAHGIGEAGIVTGFVAGLAPRLAELVGPSPPYPRNVAALTVEHVTELADEYLERAERRGASGATRVVDKSLDNIRYVGLIALLFPGAPLVWCRRDPVNNCLACYLERLTPSSQPYATDLVDTARYLRTVERLGAHWRAVLPQPPLEVVYERVVEDLEAESRRLLAHCGLAWDDVCLRFHEATRHDGTLSYDQVRRPIYRTSLDRAAGYGDRLDVLRAALREDDA